MDKGQRGEDEVEPLEAPLTEPEESGIMLISRDQARSRRRHGVAGRSILLRAGKNDALATPAPDEEAESLRPRTRADCKEGIRPCPFVTCKHHLYLDVSSRTGSIKLNFPDLEVEEMKESCVLDVADRGAAKLDEMAEVMNLTRERIRQLGVSALERLHGDLAVQGWVEGDGKRRLDLFAEDEEPEDAAKAS
jgi:hypothetical protein